MYWTLQVFWYFLTFTIFSNYIYCDINFFERGGRILNATFTSTRKHPYYASVEFINCHVCGGALIRPNAVLTSQDCLNQFNKPQAFRVRLGSTKACSGGDLAEIRKIIPHPSFDEKSLDFNAALLLLTDAYRQYKTIQLPNSKEDQKFEGRGTMIGYADPNKFTTRTLQQKELTKAPDILCESFDELLTSSQMCAIGTGPVEGFEGSPFIHDSKLYGILSSKTFDLGSPEPTIMTKVTSLLDWLDSEILE